MKLRPYQTDAVNATIESLRTHSSTLLVMPTGTGKTVVFVELARMARKGRCMILAHREELINQAVAKVEAITGERPDVEQASRRADVDLFRRTKVVVSSIQTQVAGDPPRMERFNPKDFSLVILDEAHHAPAASWRMVVDHYRQNPACRIIGVTATPDRADQEAMGQVFEDVAFEYTIEQAISDGYLVPIRQRIVDVEDIDFSHVRTTAGDLNGADLAAIMEDEHVLQGVAGPTMEHAAGRRCLIFTASVRQAQQLAEIINRHGGGEAVWVSGKTPRLERQDTVRRFSEGEVQYLVNVGVFTEGFDEPGIEMVVMARPTKSRSLYCQMIGRGTRTLSGVVDRPELCTAESRRLAIASSGKPTVEVLDFAGNAGRHRLVTCMDILGGSCPDEVRDRAARIAADADDSTDPAEVLEEAQQELLDEAERDRLEAIAKREKILAKVRHSSTAVDPFNTLHVEVPVEMESVQRPATDKQVMFLARHGVDADSYSFRKATRAVVAILDRLKRGLASPKQVATLAKYDVDAVNMSRDDASKALDRIAARGWSP